MCHLQQLSSCQCLLTSDAFDSFLIPNIKKTLRHINRWWGLTAQCDWVCLYNRRWIDCQFRWRNSWKFTYRHTYVISHIRCVINILFLITVIKCKWNSMELKDNRSEPDFVIETPDRNLLEIKSITKITGCHFNLSTLTKCKTIKTSPLLDRQLSPAHGSPFLVLIG